MSNKKSVQRSIKSRQLKSGMLFHKFDGSLATPLAIGQDAEVTQEIVKLGTGNYTLILDHAYEQDLVPVSILSDVAVGFKIQAVADDRITILCEDDAGAPVDGVIHLTLATFDNRFKH